MLLYAIMSYAVFLVSFVYAVGFVGNYLAPKSIDVGGRTGVSEAIVVDMLLLGLFAIQHSIMARQAIKQSWYRRHVPMLLPHIFSHHRVEDRTTQGSWEGGVRGTCT